MAQAEFLVPRAVSYINTHPYTVARIRCAFHLSQFLAMPRFLDTSTGKFIWIADPSTVIYAILSHTWRTDDEGGEQTYDDVRKLWKRVENGQWVWGQVCKC